MTRLPLDPAHLMSLIRRFAPGDAHVSIAEAAETQGVAGLLHGLLANSSADIPIAPGERRRLKAVGERITQHTLTSMATAMWLSKRLAQEEIHVMAIGGHSVLRLYDHSGMRPLGDLDLLIRPAEADRLKVILKAAGFSPAPSYPDLFSRPPCLIDIHTHPLNIDRVKSRHVLFPRCLDALWDRARSSFTPGKGLLLPDPADGFVLLCVHALKHSFARLIWLVDLHLQVCRWSRQRDAWETLIHRTRLWRQQRSVLYGLLLIRQLFHSPIPPHVLTELGESELSPIERWLLQMKGVGARFRYLYIPLWLNRKISIRSRLALLQETLCPRPPVMAQIHGIPIDGLSRSDYLRRTAHAASALIREGGRAAAFFRTYRR